MTNIEIRRGDTKTTILTLTDTSDPDPEVRPPLDLTGKRVTVTCKEKVDGATVYQHFIVIDEAGVVTDAEGLALAGDADAGVLTETFSSEETKEFKPTKAGRTYPWDVEIRAPGSPDVVSTPLEGTHTITGDVTTPAG